jgi:hypothetical protein
VEVETEYGKFVVPVTVLDLKKQDGVEAPSESAEEDKRTPYVFWGGIRSTAQQNGCALMSLALTGQKVYAITHLEQASVQKPDNLAEILSQKSDFSLQAEITEKIAEQIGLGKFNLMGYSTGASIALETAVRMSKDESKKDALQDLVVIEPLGLEELGVAKLGYKFGVQESSKLVGKSEARIKVLQQGGASNEEDLKLDWETVKILAKKMFDAKRLSEINVAGNFQWWVGDQSPVQNFPLTEEVIQQVQQMMLEKNSDANIPELNEVQDSTHSILNMNALGLAQEFIQPRKVQQGNPRELRRKDLANSAMSAILQEITI